MPNTKKLLSVSNLKKYFPIPKSNLFQKEQYYVRANEEISFDVYEGETIGIVGESGCGKSTLGRVILQLYEQTAGTTMYYGRSLSEVAPEYARKIYKNPEKYVKKYLAAKEKADKLTKQCEEAGESVTFFGLQSKNLAVAEAETALSKVVKLLGGFIAVPSLKEHAAVLLERFELHVATNKLRNAVAESKLNEDFARAKIKEAMDGEDAAKVIAKYDKVIAAEESRQHDLNEKIAAIAEKRTALREKIAAIKEQYKDDPEFCRFEAMLDDGIDLAQLKYSEMRLLRKDLQIIFQDPYSSLNPRMTVGQIIEEGLLTHKFFKHGSPAMKEYILEVMRSCGLQDYMLHRYPHQFSGGQRQRICIARALAVKPRFVVCDECVSALDVSIQSQIINLLQELKEKENLTYLFISHDLSVVRYVSDRICVMYLGNVVEFASAATLFADPRHPYTLALLSSIPTTDPDSASKERIILEGNVPSPIRPPEGCKFHTRCYMACDKCKRVPPQLTEIEPGHFVACHFAQRKLDEQGNYLFELPKPNTKSEEKKDVVEETEKGE